MSKSHPFRQLQLIFEANSMRGVCVVPQPLVIRMGQLDWCNDCCSGCLMASLPKQVLSTTAGTVNIEMTCRDLG